MNSYKKVVAFWIGAIIVLGLLTANFWTTKNSTKPQEIIYSEFLSQVSQGRVVEVSIEGSHLTGSLYDGQRFLTQLPFSTFFTPDLMRALESSKVRIKAVPHAEPSPSLFQIFISSLPALVLIGIAIFFMRQQSSGRGGALGFGRSRVKLLHEQPGGRVTFADVAGVDEAKEELAEVVDFLRTPHKFQKLGGKIPKGILLMGPPGTGKTLLARAIAGEAGVPFFSVSGSEFVEMFVGVGASRVRDTFTQGKKNAPCIIFIDEIDAVGRHRGAGLGGGNDEREQTLNQLLVEMDGFEANEGVILVGATNRPDVLDPALLRPGRFDREIVVPSPDVTGREQILNVHIRRILIDDDVNMQVIARGTPGFSGADLANLVNEAALLAGRHNKKKVSMIEFEEVRDRLIMGGRERRSLVMTEKEKWTTCYHEAGHAVVAWHSPESDPIHKATIVPRGRALGVVMRLPEGDQVSASYAHLVADITVAMGGRVAEELVFGRDRVTTGASQDIKTATAIARRMVTEWGMSQNLGPLTYGESSQEIFLGHSVTQHKNISEATAEKIDLEIRTLVESNYQRALHILSHHRDQLDLIAQQLFEKETLSGSEITKLLSPNHPVPETPDSGKTDKKKSSQKEAKLSQSKEAQTSPTSSTLTDGKNLKPRKPQKKSSKSVEL